MEISEHTIALLAQPLDDKMPNVTVTSPPPAPPPASTAPAFPLRSVRLRSPSVITTDFDLLRFEAAAQGQLVLTSSPSPSPSPSSSTTSSSSSTTTTTTTEPQTKESEEPETQTSNLLITSPYNKPQHHLSLSLSPSPGTPLPPPLPLPSLLLALALTALGPTTPTYATTPYTSALNFPVVTSLLRYLLAREGVTWVATRFYVVVFRSKLNAHIDTERLFRLDEESHREAVESGGLLKYWFGAGDGEGRNLATCFWHSREDAVRGGLGSWHRKARMAGREFYESIEFSTFWFTVLDGAEGYRFEEYNG